MSGAAGKSPAGQPPAGQPSADQPFPRKAPARKAPAGTAPAGTLPAGASFATGAPLSPRPADSTRPAPEVAAGAGLRIPDGSQAVVHVGGCAVRLTNLDKPFWPALGLTKRDLLQYYADVAPVLLPHLADRAMVMKRTPDGAAGEPFFMKRAPTPRPDWIRTCAITHGSGSVIDFPMVQDLASLLWVVNLGCIDLHP